ncbi:hypothetical protein O7626_19245 [Micromonospora sp. WMMD1102]|nr:hypothetical protein [Micromonospora sp. WMMD1102]MDG4788050.1 hypothetical protein [Micromonospora sp. WMMD1102]
MTFGSTATPLTGTDTLVARWPGRGTTCREIGAVSARASEGRA